MRGRVEINPDVRAVLAGGKFEGTVFHLPAGKLDRKLYEAVNKVLEALGGKWDRRQQGHVFTIASADELEAALQAGEVIDPKKANEQFFTPIEIAVRMTDIAATHRRLARVLEPSAGDGRLVAQAVLCGASVTAVEIDPKLCEFLRGHFPGVDVHQADFLDWRPDPALLIDAVLMNPPFGARADMRHVRHAFGFLRPGGILVAIMSPHFTFAYHREARDFHQWALSAGGEWELLPASTFRESGTNVRAGILTLRKPY